MDVSKKKKHAEPGPPPPPPLPPSSNYMNLEPAAKGSPTAGCDGRKTDNYMNLEFSESLCHYENAKHVLTKAGLQPTAGNACDKCGHQKRRCEVNGDEKGDYMTMEPVSGRMVAAKRNPFPGYLPMCPVTEGGKRQDNGNMLRDMLNRGLAEKSASIPSLNNECGGRQTGAILGDGAPPVVNKNLSRVDEPRRRSSSAGSSRYDQEEPIADDPPCRAGASNRTSSAESVTSQIAAKCPAAVAPSSPSSGGASSAARDDHQTTLVHIRRSSSVPCKNNRDSSSSNDSGVSTGSLRYRGADFAEFELPLTTAMSTMRHRRTMAADGGPVPAAAAAAAGCVHGSLPRRSKSTDRLKELSFRFQKVAGPMKSSSAGAEVPVCMKKDKGR